ncbi:hypothetical protein EIP91_004935 [Steccherinum ochraceum]|uniref:Extracellular membrane protein CFEM domain-containing protein n=1 Tax=Steccherinum ochraceum TaxID=92696 RepID=A0A4R0RN67_9APHY|nr:hypothetical protein EIP91_004935 [Steccherinum ochraceum]
MLVVIGAVLLTGQTAAQGPLSQSLHARQFDPGDVGTQCEDTCTKAAMLEQCASAQTTPDCFCTEDFNKGVVDCYNCLLGLSGNSEEEAQSFQIGIGAIEDECKSLGHPLNSLSVNGALPTSQPTGGAGSASGSAAATTTTGSLSATSSSSQYASPTSGGGASTGGAASGDAVLSVHAGSLVVLLGLLGGGMAVFAI